MTYRTKIIALSAAILLLSINAIAITDIQGVIAQGENRMPMLSKIVNTEEEPVPVSLQGTGDVSGNVNATQAGEWHVGAEQNGEWGVKAEQDGDWTVGLDPESNTVQVDGLSSSTREPFQITMSPSITEADEDSQFSSTESFVVPDGKLLVIEHMSAKAFMKGGNIPRAVELRTAAIRPFEGLTGGYFPDRTGHQLMMTEETGSLQGKDFVGAQNTLFYAEGGNEVELLFGRDGDSGTAQIFFTATGYLVDLPS